MIGYYAHSHGSGHCNYANIFAKVFGESLIVLTDRKHTFDDDVQVVGLPNEDTDGSEFDRQMFPEPRALHYAPININKITQRNRTLLDVILKKEIRLIIIDVSVEIAMLARVSSVPYAYVRLHGDRKDFAHLNAYEGASFLLAYYPKEMENKNTPTWIRNKTLYLGFISRYMFGTKPSEKPVEYGDYRKPILLHITGFGGSLPLNFTELSQCYDIFSIGPGRLDCKPCDVVHIGVVDETQAFIEHADIIVAACGSNTVSEILSLGKAFVAVPEERPYREQELSAENLERLGWAVNLKKYPCLFDAIAEAKKLNSVDYPKAEATNLLEFFCSLKTFEFRADRFVALSESIANPVPVTENDVPFPPEHKIYPL